MKRPSTFFSPTIILIAALSFIGLADSARAQDVEPPTVLSAVFANENTEIILTFSEPMHRDQAMEPGNYFVTEPFGERFVLTVSQEDAAGAQYRLTLDAAAAAGSSLTLFWISDLAENYIEPNPTTLMIQGDSVDTTPPTAQSAVFGNLRTAVIVTFSEPMDQSQVLDSGNYLVTEPSGVSLAIASITPHNASGRQYRLNLNATASSGSTLTVLNVSDLPLNVIDPNPTTLPIQDSGDETRPTVLSTEFGNSSNTFVIVTFSETMHPDQVFNAGHYILTGPSGENVPIAGVSQENAAGTRFRLHLTAPGSTGSQLTVSDVSDLALNAIDPNPTTLPVPGIRDTTPPAVSAAVSTSLLAPPNHKLVDVGFTVTATDNVTENPTINVQVLSDEALSAGDVSYIDGVLTLRATRDNAGDGRVYLIVVTAADQAGNAASTCTTVVVPYNNSPAAIATVQAQAAALCQ